MTIYRINPDLLKPEGASDGDVVTYVSANSRVEWAAPTGGGGDVANVWVNANDYATYISITSNLNSVNSNVDSIAANLYNTYTTLTANDYATLLASQSNDYNTYTTLSANDYNSYNTLTANIYNTFAYLNANVGGGGDASNAWVNSNDYATYTTLSSLIDTVQDNVAALGGTADLDSDQFTISTSNSFTLSKTVSDANNILVTLNGIVQKPTSDYVVSSTTLTLANVEPLASGIELEVRHLNGGSAGGGGGISLTDLSVTTNSPSGNGALSYDNTSGVFTFTPADTSTGGGGGGITTGKAIAMAMIFGG